MEQPQQSCFINTSDPAEDETQAPGNMLCAATEVMCAEDPVMMKISVDAVWPLLRHSA